MKYRMCSVKRSLFVVFIAGSLFEIECRQVIESRFDDSNVRAAHTAGFVINRKDLVCFQQLSHIISSIINKKELFFKVF